MITYERTPHFNTPAIIEIRFSSPKQFSADLPLTLRGDLVNRARFQSIEPQPIRMHPLKDGVLATLPLVADSFPGKISLIHQASSIGPLSSSISVGDQTIQVNQFALP
jgi:hypothetical protein